MLEIMTSPLVQSKAHYNHLIWLLKTVQDLRMLITVGLEGEVKSQQTERQEKNTSRGQEVLQLIVRRLTVFSFILSSL